MWLLLGILMVPVLALAACGGSDETPAEVATIERITAEPPDDPAEDETVAETGPVTYLERARNREFENASVTIMGAWTDGEAEAFRTTLAPFIEDTGIKVTFEGTDDFAELIVARSEAGDPPDVAIFPQPDLLADFSRQGLLADQAEILDLSRLGESYGEAWTELATVDGTLRGLPFRAQTKSLVFYSPEKWAEFGYEPPENWDELTALMDEMVANGHTPWCISVENSAATGWVATDWVEEIVLRTAGPEVYDKWINHEINFSDPEIKAAVEKMGEIWLNPDYVLGGTAGLLTTWIGDVRPLFEEPEAGCMMHRQGRWVTAFFPENIDPETQSALFYFPAINEAQGRPVLGASDIVSAFNTEPDTRALVEYLATPEAAESWVKAGGLISPNSQVPLDWYESDLSRAQAEILQKATTLRYDASDLMPGEVGTGTFWTGMIDYVGGADLDTVLAGIDASWPVE